MATAYIAIETSESSVSVSNNTSVVTATVVYYGNGVSYNSNCAVTVTIDGTTYTGTSSYKTSTSRQVLLTKSKTITHNTDGTKSISVSATFAAGVSIGNLSASKTVTLQTIPRASKIGTVENFDIEHRIKVPFTNYTTVFTHNLNIYVGGTMVKGVTGYTSNADVVFTESELLRIYNIIGTSAKSATFTITLTTKNGTHNVGQSSTTATGTIVGLSRINVNGSWKRAVPWVKVNGTWKRTIPKIRANGSWKNCRY